MDVCKRKKIKYIVWFNELWWLMMTANKTKGIPHVNLQLNYESTPILSNCPLSDIVLDFLPWLFVSLGLSHLFASLWPAPVYCILKFWHFSDIPSHPADFEWWKRSTIQRLLSVFWKYMYYRKYSVIIWICWNTAYWEIST